MRAAPYLLLPLLLVGCSAGKRADVAANAPARSVYKKQSGRAALSAPTENAPGATLAEFETPSVPRLIVRNADLVLRVPDIDAAETEIARIARSQNGTVEASQGADLAGPEPRLSLTLRVPESRFDPTLSQLETLGVRLGKTISSEDVTAQAVDLEARLKSLRVQEDAYRAILAAARRVTDVLEVQERLTGVRTEIERIVAARRDLGDQASRSRIVVNLVRAARTADAAPEPDWPAQTWGSATTDLRSIARALASLGIWLVALLPIWLPIVLVARWIVRRKALEGTSV